MGEDKRDAIEITPAMEEAGAKVLEESFDEYLSSHAFYVARRVYLAMAKAAVAREEARDTSSIPQSEDPKD